jgi:hypothetical protein
MKFRMKFMKLRGWCEKWRPLPLVPIDMIEVLTDFRFIVVMFHTPSLPPCIFAVFLVVRLQGYMV